MNISIRVTGAGRMPPLFFLRLQTIRNNSQNFVFFKEFSLKFSIFFKLRIFSLNFGILFSHFFREIFALSISKQIEAIFRGIIEKFCTLSEGTKCKKCEFFTKRFFLFAENWIPQYSGLICTKYHCTVFSPVLDNTVQCT